MKYYKISEKELLYLIERDNFLLALEAAGVDNWQGYEYAWDFVADIYYG